MVRPSSIVLFLSWILVYKSRKSRGITFTDKIPGLEPYIFNKSRKIFQPMKSDIITHIIEYIFNFSLLLLISPNFFLFHQYSITFFDTAPAQTTVALSPLLIEVCFSNRTCFNTRPKRAKVNFFGVPIVPKGRAEGKEVSLSGGPAVALFFLGVLI